MIAREPLIHFVPPATLLLAFTLLSAHAIETHDRLLLAGMLLGICISTSMLITERHRRNRLHAERRVVQGALRAARNNRWSTYRKGS